MKTAVKKWLKDNKKTIATLVATLIATAIGAITMSCSTAQKINIKQTDKKGNVQETLIESDTKVKNLAINVINK